MPKFYIRDDRIINFKNEYISFQEEYDNIWIEIIDRMKYIKSQEYNDFIDQIKIAKSQEFQEFI